MSTVNILIIVYFVRNLFNNKGGDNKPDESKDQMNSTNLSIDIIQNFIKLHKKKEG